MFIILIQIIYRRFVACNLLRIRENENELIQWAHSSICYSMPWAVIKASATCCMLGSPKKTGSIYTLSLDREELKPSLNISGPGKKPQLNKKPFINFQFEISQVQFVLCKLQHDATQIKQNKPIFSINLRCVARSVKCAGRSKHVQWLESHWNSTRYVAANCIQNEFPIGNDTALPVTCHRIDVYPRWSMQINFHPGKCGHFNWKILLNRRGWQLRHQIIRR